MRHMLVFVAVALTAAGGRAACDSCHAAENRDTHPVSIDYARARLHDPMRYKPATAAVTALLVDGKVECTSCHVSHDDQTDQRYRLRMDENALCLTCHVMN